MFDNVVANSQFFLNLLLMLALFSHSFAEENVYKIVINFKQKNSFIVLYVIITGG